MSSSCIEDQSVQESPWFRIVQDMLNQADIEINGSRPFDIRVNNPDFLNGCYKEDLWH